MAVSRPRGRPTTSDPSPIRRVPLTSGSTPYRPPSPAPAPGAQTVPVRNLSRLDSRKNSTVSTSSTAMMPTVTATDRTAQTNRALTISRSPVRALRRAMLSSGGVVAMAPSGGSHPPAQVGGAGGWQARSVGCEGSACGQERLQLRQALRVVLLGRRHIADIGDELRCLLQIELDELLDLGPLERVFLHVDVERPGERVLAGGDRLGGGLDARGALLGDLDVLQAFLVVLVVGVAEVAPGVGLALDALDQGVVVGGGGVVAARLEAAGVGVTENLLVEEVVGARLGVGGEDGDLLAGEAGVDLVPGLGAAFLEDLGELLEGQRVQELVLGRGDDGQAVEPDAELLVLDVLARAGSLLLVLDRAGGVGDVGLAVAELGEAAAGARGAHGDPDARLLLAELRGDRLADRGDGRGPVDHDVAAERGRAAARGGDQGGRQGQAEQPAAAGGPSCHAYKPP